MPVDMPSLARAEAAVKSLEEFAHQFSPRSNAAVSITGSGGLAIGVGFLAILAIVVAVASVLVVRAETEKAVGIMAADRRADAMVAELLRERTAEMKAQVATLEVYKTRHEGVATSHETRIKALETKR
jgi:NAD/NADP transhydrogenase alpha subunit